MDARPEPAFQVGNRVYFDARSNPVAYDGSPVTWRVGAYALALRDGRVLMVQQGRGVHWELPGGGVEVEEPLADAAARECLEETGYRFVADPGPPAHADEMFFWMRGRASYHHSLLFVIRGTVADPAPEWRPLHDDEISAVAWRDPATLTPAETHPRYWAALAALGLVSADRTADSAPARGSDSA